MKLHHKYNNMNYYEVFFSKNVFIINIKYLKLSYARVLVKFYVSAMYHVVCNLQISQNIIFN